MSQAIKILNDEMQCDIIKIRNLVHNKVCFKSIDYFMHLLEQFYSGKNVFYLNYRGFYILPSNPLFFFLFSSSFFNLPSEAYGFTFCYLKFLLAEYFPEIHGVKYVT